MNSNLQPDILTQFWCVDLQVTGVRANTPEMSESSVPEDESPEESMHPPAQQDLMRGLDRNIQQLFKRLILQLFLPKFLDQ